MPLNHGMILTRSGSRVVAKVVTDLFRICPGLHKLLAAILAGVTDDVGCDKGFAKSTCLMQLQGLKNSW